MSTPAFRPDPRIKPMPADEIRRRFVDFFAERGHDVVPSASLVPGGDQTLLFTNSGMVQFKELLAGTEKRSYSRAVDYQRCLRVAGKHNDFEEVGRTPRHHTLFEMLGNWSFGDYFKREAIHWAWEFLTGEMGIPADRLAATVYATDDFSYGVWSTEIGLPPERIARWGDWEHGDEKNFWRMADTGPAGPCSEIHFDRGIEFSEGPECVPDHSELCPRWLEIWNLVFMEFNLAVDRSLTPLPIQSVDTGMGLERLASVLQGVGTNYDTDLFAPIHARMRELLGHDPESFEAERFSYQVIADHSRAATFLIADGVLPSNEGRGYVLRRILRRAVRHGRLLGRREPFMAETARVVIESMGDAYPLLRERSTEIVGAILREESQFARTLDAGTVHLEEALIPLTDAERVVGRRPEDLPAGASVLDGEVAFRLHDTYGFPVDLTVELTAEYGVAVDRPGFDRALAIQKDRSRSGKKADLLRQATAGAVYESLVRRTGPTTFLGYETLAAEGRVLAILRDGVEYESLTAVGDEELRLPAGATAELILDRTPFYGEGGGQVGDRGVYRNATGEVIFEVEDCQKPVGGMFVLRGTLRGSVALGETLTGQVDAQRRAATMRNHTGTHLLHRALRNVVGERARQAGSLVTPDYLRFDYPFDRALTPDEVRAIEDEVRAIIREDRPVSIASMTMPEAVEGGADAFFDEKYGETVRTVKVADYSFELCGGTHCRASGQIGAFVITSDRSIGSNSRRIEALTGAGADAWFRARQDLVVEAAAALGAQTPEGIRDRITALQEELREARRRLKAGASTALPGPRDLADRAEAVAGTPVLLFAGAWDSIDTVKAIAKDLRGLMPSGVIALALEADEPQLFVTVSDELIARGLGAGDLVRAAVPAIDGKGGGRPGMAQGRGTNRAGLAASLDAIRAAVRSALDRPD